MKTSHIKLELIRIDGGTQPRVSLDESAIAEYSDRMKAGDEFPPIRVFNDGSELWLSRGFHRYHAAKLAGCDKIEAESVQGTRRDAILDALSDNATHGVRRTNADKRKAVTTLLEDDEWAKWSNNRISSECGVSLDLVNRMRSSLNESLSEQRVERTYTTKHGTQAVMNTANIGRPKTEKVVVDTSTGEVLEDAAVITTKPNKISSAPKQRQRGNYEDGETMLDALRGMCDVINNMLGMRPKETMVMRVVESARDVISGLDDLINQITKE